MVLNNIFIDFCIQCLLNVWNFILQCSVAKSECLLAKLCKLLLMLLLFVVHCSCDQKWYPLLMWLKSHS